MLNTNGLRIAREPGFAERLAEFRPGFEVYLQFDSPRRDALMESARRRPRRASARRRWKRWSAAGISTTLVVRRQEGRQRRRDRATIVRFALQWRCVRGVTFQPIQDAGRNEGFDPKPHRIVLTDIRRRIAEAGVFALEDLIPLPCNPDQICIGYGLRDGASVHADHLADAARAVRRRRAQHGHLRALSGAAAAGLRPALAVHRPGRHRGQAGQPALLPAGHRGAGELGYEHTFRW